MITQLSPNLYRVQDTCAVYLIKHGPRAVAIDFGSGKWLAKLGDLGIQHLDHVLLTHHHADQCAGLAGLGERSFVVHAAPGERRFLEPAKAQALVAELAKPMRGCPPSYSILPGGIADIQYDMGGFSDWYWQDQRLRFLHTPGHGPEAVSVLADVDGRQVLFAGDAVHAGGQIWQPYHLEWDHWTGSGALAAWEGVERLRGPRVDWLCPSHGPVVTSGVGRQLATLSRRLLAFYHAKGQISRGEADRYWPSTAVPGGRQLLPDLYQFGVNSYLLRSANGEALIVDPYLGDIASLPALLAGLPGVRPTMAVATHYHYDHCDGIPWLREHHGVRVAMHPIVAHPLRLPSGLAAPWLPPQPILADELWPNEGTWRWREFEFQVAPWPGQTWGHCLFMAMVNGVKTAFVGDSFQPPSRWNGTGGFCSYNRGRFSGFSESADRLRTWQPELLAAGHQTYCHYHAPRFAKISRWAATAAEATLALCPGNDLSTQYYRAGLWDTW